MTPAGTTQQSPTAPPPLSTQPEEHKDVCENNESSSGCHAVVQPWQTLHTAHAHDAKGVEALDRPDTTRLDAHNALGVSREDRESSVHPTGSTNIQTLKQTLKMLQHQPVRYLV